jgi:glycosyltransferase involved in cell wall biosynthesis
MNRIIIFSTNYFPNVGGAEIAIKEITDRLGEQYEFDMITPRYSREHKSMEMIGNITVHRVGLGSLFGKFGIPVFGTLKALVLHRKQNYDLIWSMMASQASVSASFFKMVKQIPLILTLQEGDEEKHLMRFVGGSVLLYKVFIRPWYTLVFKHADRITTISTYLKNRAQEENSVVSIDVIPNGVDVDRFSKQLTDEEKRRTRDELRLQESDTLLIHTGRLVEKNALDVVINSLPLLPDTVHFLTLGDGHLRDELMEIAQSVGVASRVHFIPSVDHEKLIEYQASADIFIRPSRSEGMGNSFVEAMVARIPVIGTRAGGIADFLFGKDKEDNHTQTGFVVRVDRPDDVAQQVKYIISHKDDVRKVIDRAFELVSRDYNWDSIAKKMVNVAFDPLLRARS